MKKLNLYSILSATGIAVVLFSPAGQLRAQTRGSYIINGKIVDLTTGKVYLSHEDENKKTITDSTDLNNGNFIFKGTLQQPRFYQIGLKGTKNTSSFILENTSLTFTASKDSIYKAKITGSKAQDVYSGFYNGPWKSITAKAGEIYQRLDKAEQSGKIKLDSATHARFDAEFRKLDTLNKIAVTGYINQHQNSVGSAAIIYDRFIAYPNYPVAKELFAQLSVDVQKTTIGKEITDAIALDARTSTGKVAPPFSMADKDGKIVHLSDFKGKYVMVDFWASWCGPCRKENPNVVAAYKKYHDKGFEILGVSLDSKKEAWLKAIKDDALTWTHVSDLKGWANTAANEYGVKAVPASFLIGPDGKVIGKDLRGEELNKKLASLFK